MLRGKFTTTHQEKHKRYKFHPGLKQLSQPHGQRQTPTPLNAHFLCNPLPLPLPSRSPSAHLHQNPDSLGSSSSSSSSLTSPSQRRAGVRVGVGSAACGARQTARIRRTGLISRLFTNQHRRYRDHRASRATPADRAGVCERGVCV